MLILALDTCGSCCAVCVWQDGRVVAQAREHMERGQDARLMPMIVDVLATSGFAFSDLDKIAVTRGPGSFTGVRVGLAAARGIGLAARKPVIGVDRFSIYAALHKEDRKNLLVVINSKRAELFCKFFPATGAPQEACAMTEEEIRAFTQTHAGTVIAGDSGTPGDDVVKSGAALAAQAETGDPAFLPLPLYLRAPDVTFPARAR